MNLLAPPARPVNLRSPASPAFFAALLAFFPGCALVTNGLHQSVEIASVPAGATVVIDGVEAGQTPLTTRLSRTRPHRVELHKAGFVTATRNVLTRDDTYMRQPVRFGVDIDSGAANELTPAAISVELKPVAIVTVASGDEFDQMTAAVLAADDLWHQGSISETEHRDRIEKILARFAR